MKPTRLRPTGEPTHRSTMWWGSVRNAPFWTWLALLGIAAVSAVDGARDRLAPPHPTWLGSAPNAFAMVALCFGWMMVRMPDRRGRPIASVRRLFWRGWLGSLLGLMIWEFVQRAGHLVFDPNDLAATVVGAVLCWALFRMLTSRWRWKE